METKHTPGPWEISDTEDIGTWDTAVASMDGFRDGDPVDAEENEANRNLICAAPDMLEALQGLFKHTSMIHKHWGDGDNTKECNVAVEMAQAAIIKATTC